MIIELTEKEKSQLLFAINQTVRTSDNALQVAAELLPLAGRLSQLKDDAPITETVSE